MATRSNIRIQLTHLAGKVSQAEKNATKQIKTILKGTERFRSEQLKNVKLIIKRAQRLRASPLTQRAEELKQRIETGASAGFQLLLTRLNVPSKNEVERLQKKLVGMQKRIEELEKQTSKS